MNQQANTLRADIIAAADQANPARQIPNGNENRADYMAGSVARLAGLWANTNAAALKYVGPTSAEVQRVIREKSDAVAKAQTAVTRAHLNLVNSLGGAEAAATMSAQQQNELLDPALIEAKNRASRVAQLLRDEVEAARKQLAPALAFEKAKDEAVQILSQLLNAL